MEKIKVYLVDVCNYEFDTSPLIWDDNKFINEVTIQGNVFTLSSFQKHYNDYNLIVDSFIRFIDLND